MKTTTGILLAACVMQFAGCAFGTRYVELSYPPANAVTMEAADTKPAVSGPRTRQIRLVVHDAREYTDRIGNIRNTYGMKTASILTEDNIAIWVHDAVAFELARLGHQVVQQTSAASGGAEDRLTADVQKVYCDIYAAYDGEVTLQATLERTGEEPVTMNIPAKKVSGLSFAGTGKSTGESLAQALQIAIKTMLRDFGFTDKDKQQAEP